MLTKTLFHPADGNSKLPLVNAQVLHVEFVPKLDTVTCNCHLYAAQQSLFLRNSL